MSPIERSAGGGGTGGGGTTKIFDSTLGVAAAAIDTGANGIPAGFGALQVFVISRTTQAVVFSTVQFSVNGDTGTNYEIELLQSQNSATSGGTAIGGTKQWNLDSPGTGFSANFPAVHTFMFPGYDKTTFFKVGTALEAMPSLTAAQVTTQNNAVGWSSTAAINQFTATAGSGNLVAGSRMIVYGLP